MKYPNNPKLYDLEPHLVFGTTEAAEVHLQTARKGKTPTTNPPTTKTANRATNPQENPKPNQSTVTNPPRPATATQGTPAVWNPGTGSP